MSQSDLITIRLTLDELQLIVRLLSRFEDNHEWGYLQERLSVLKLKTGLVQKEEPAPTPTDS